VNFGISQFQNFGPI